MKEIKTKITINLAAIKHFT